VLCALATAALGGRLARDLAHGSALAAAFAAAWVLGFYPTAIHAASGMETLLAAALLTALVLAHVQESRHGIAIGGLSLALGLVRPEHNVAAVLLLTHALWRARGSDRTGLARGTALAYLLPGAVYFAARAAYYGPPAADSVLREDRGWPPLPGRRERARVRPRARRPALAVRGARHRERGAPARAGMARDRRRDRGRVSCPIP
jgi:hypothetical protein